MIDIKELMRILDREAPLMLSEKQIEQGAYDNSGLLVHSHDEVKKILFSLDLSNEAVKKAKNLKCDTIITHHPAIYSPLKKLDKDSDSASVLNAIKNDINVISMHLNLDVASGGIDECLARGLGGKGCKYLFDTDEKHGYGREFSVEETTFLNFVKNAKQTFSTKRVLTYGVDRASIKKVASFCGGGSEFVMRYLLSGGVADVIVSSDLPHHVIKAVIERDKCLLILTHYASENYGFNVFYKNIGSDLNGKIETVFFEDKRFL